MIGVGSTMVVDFTCYSLDRSFRPQPALGLPRQRGRSYPRSSGVRSRQSDPSAARPSPTHLLARRVRQQSCYRIACASTLTLLGCGFLGRPMPL